VIDTVVLFCTEKFKHTFGACSEQSIMLCSVD
jgi:hypothetical protein